MNEKAINEEIDHIVNSHHSYLKTELPLLSRLVNKIANVHGPSDGELYELDRLFHQLKAKLEDHLSKEEDFLFPQIKKLVNTPSGMDTTQLFQTIDELNKIEATVNDLLKKMRIITSDYTLPEHACRSYTMTFTKLGEIESDLFTHLHFENNIIFSRLLADANQ